ncbi:MAG: 5'/3'-nucleotidase SurE [Gemmatimonadetes bacterium]|nr:5'/3'-nucleotidase SurE [Gemmatimonadota bacterium]HCV23342.1 5'/3'-nucleotidase SurE [Candidatus Latescibacterota bacterium]
MHPPRRDGKHSLDTAVHLPEHPRGEWVLVTNDDGVDSPALRPLLTEISELCPVVGIAPAQEFSWTSKTLSRFARPRLERQDEDLPCPLFSLDGSPADCANVGVHCLYSNPPSLVVSGMNVGANAGLAFLLSSGTVGAAVEGMLSGVPSIAFSVQLRAQDYARWRTEREDFLESTWKNGAAVSGQITAEVLTHGLPAGSSVLSVNMPPDIQISTPRCLTRVTPTSYGSFFRQCDDGSFEHHYNGYRRVGSGEDGDIEVLERGQVAMTPLRFDLTAPIDSTDQARFETGSGR